MDVRLPTGQVITNVPEGTSKDDLVAKLQANGIDTSWYQPKESSLRQVADVPLQFGKGLVDSVASIADVFGADNPASEYLKGTSDYIAALLSAQSKKDSAEIAKIMADAQGKGVWENVKAGLKAFATAPVDTLSNALGSTVPYVAAGLAASTGVPELAALAGAGATVSRAAGAAIGSAALGAAGGAGSVKGQIYDDVKASLIKQGVDKDKAGEVASQAQAYGGKNLDQILIGAGLGALASATGAEAGLVKGLGERIAGKAVTEGAEELGASAAARLAKGAATEGSTEFAQQGQQQMAANIARQREGEDVGTMDNVLPQATFAGIAGAVLGGGTEVATGAGPKEIQPKSPVNQELLDALDVFNRDQKAKGLKPVLMLEDLSGNNVLRFANENKEKFPVLGEILNSDLRRDIKIDRLKSFMAPAFETSAEPVQAEGRIALPPPTEGEKPIAAQQAVAEAMSAGVPVEGKLSVAKGPEGGYRVSDDQGRVLTREINNAYEAETAAKALEIYGQKQQFGEIRNEEGVTPPDTLAPLTSDLRPIDRTTGEIEPAPAPKTYEAPVPALKVKKEPINRQTLAQFIRKNGGIRPDSTDATGRVARLADYGLTTKNSRGLVRENGMTHEQAVDLAMSNGFYGEEAARLNAKREGQGEGSYQVSPEAVDQMLSDLAGQKFRDKDVQLMDEAKKAREEREQLGPYKDVISKYSKDNKLKLDEGTIRDAAIHMRETRKNAKDAVDTIIADRQVEEARQAAEEAWANIESLYNNSDEEALPAGEYDKSANREQRNERMKVKRELQKLKDQYAKMDTEAGRRQQAANPQYAAKVNELRSAIAVQEQILSTFQNPKNVGRNKLSKGEVKEAIDLVMQRGEGEAAPAGFRMPFEPRKPADNRPYVAPEVAKGPSEERVAAANKVINDHLTKLEEQGAQGKEAAKAIRQALASGAFSPAQMELAFRMGDTITRIIGRSAALPYVIQFQSKIAGYYGRKQTAQIGKTDFEGNTKTLQGMISIALGDPNLKHTTSAHEAFHVLQDLFNGFDPEAARVINKAFSGAKTLDDIDPRILDKLKSTRDPNTKQTFYSKIKNEIENKRINEMTDQVQKEREFQAYVFQTLDEMAERGIPVTGFGAAFTRFLNFFKNFRKNISELFNKSKEPDVLALMEKGRTGELAAGLGIEGKVTPFAAGTEYGDIIERDKAEEAQVREEIRATGDETNAKIVSTRWGKSWDAVKEFFDPFALVPDIDQFLRYRNLMMGSVRMSHDLGRRLSDIIRKSDKADSERVYKFLTTRDASPSAIQNEKVRAAAIEAKNKINEIADTLLVRKEITPEAYEKFYDQYLPRIYMYYEETGRGMRAPLGSPGEKGWAKARNETLSQEEREMLGEIKDPAYLVYVAISRPLRDLAMADYLGSIASYANQTKGRDWILPASLTEWPVGSGKKMSAYALKYMAEDMERTSLAEAERIGDKAAAGRIANEIKRMKEAAEASIRETTNMKSFETSRYQKMPENRRYGVMAGAYVDKAIYNDLVGTFMPVGKDNVSLLEGLLGDERSALVKAQGIWKLGKTTLNPATQFTNFFSNGIALNIFGGVPFRRFGKLLRRYAQERLDNGPMWQEAQKYGISGGTMSSAELRNALRLLKDYSDKTGSNESILTMFGHMRTYLSAASNVIQKAGDLYQESEVLFKMMKYIHAREYEGMDASAAVNAANDTMFDYSRVNPSIRWLRNAPIGLPFVTYYYKALPKFFETLVKNPLRFAPYVALYYALPAMTMATFDLTDDELEALRKSAADYIRDNGSLMFLPIRDSDGNIEMVDVGKYFPWGAFTDPLKTMFLRGEYTKGAKKLLQPVTPSGPMVTAIAALTTGIDPFTMKPIYNDHDTAQGKAAAIFSYLFNQAAPPVFSVDIENIENSKGAVAKIYNSLTENGTGLDRRGLPKPEVVESIASLMGINVTPLRADLQRASNINYMLNQINQTKALATMTAKDQSLSVEKRQEKMRALYEKIKQDMLKIQEYATETEPALGAAQKVKGS